MIRIRTGSRLHFGLFSLPSDGATAWPNSEGVPTIPRRAFGGVGMMIDKPGIELSVERAKAWSSEGPLALRALEFAQRCAAFLGTKTCFHIRMESAACEHSGLGTGTQLGLAVATAIDRLIDRGGSTLQALAASLGRGRRSAIGIHGFSAGGLIVEGGKNADVAVAPMLVRYDFPEAWRIVLITPRNLQGKHGAQEIDAFTRLLGCVRDDATTDSLCRLVLLGMLPALVDVDIMAFGEALYDFNRRSGLLFKSAQGGVYCHPRVEEIVLRLRECGVRGVGQSSWGPAVFALVAMDQAAALRDYLIARNIAALDEITITSACNHGARTEY
ncbi:MAG: beta-RFAP synthase [Planctomycetes bacterium]|nr:beta-RFAP synthase [Planctomycetota bacterium]